MRFLSCERVSEHKYKTPEGYLVCVDSVLARTGKQTYHRDEVFHDGDDSEIEVDRKPEEVFSAQTLASFENKPLTVEHPEVDITADNHKDYAVGYVRDVKRGEVDGEPVMLGTLVITDAPTIEEIENGEHTDLSCGYNCDIDDEENPQQRNIRGNHVALCQSGRAGIARIVDSKENDMAKRHYETTDLNAYMLDADIKDNELPDKAYDALWDLFNRINRSKVDKRYDISDFVREVEQSLRRNGITNKVVVKPTGDWKKTNDGRVERTYTCKVEGYTDDIKVMFIVTADTRETTAVSANIFDSVRDDDDVEDDCTKDDFYSAFTTMADVFADKLHGYVSQGKSIDKAFADMKFTKQGNQYVKHSGKYDIVFAVDGKKVTYYVLENGRIPSGYTRTIMTLDSCTKDEPDMDTTSGRMQIYEQKMMSALDNIPAAHWNKQGSKVNIDNNRITMVTTPSGVKVIANGVTHVYTERDDIANAINRLYRQKVKDMNNSRFTDDSAFREVQQELKKMGYDIYAWRQFSDGDIIAETDFSCFTRRSDQQLERDLRKLRKYAARVSWTPDTLMFIRPKFTTKDSRIIDCRTDSTTASKINRIITIVKKISKS